MFILSKKRVTVIMSMLLLSIFVFVFQTANLEKIVPTVSLPVSSKVIVLDARTSEYQMKEHKVKMGPQRHKQI